MRAISRLHAIETRDPDEIAAGVQRATVSYLPLRAARDSWQLSRVALATGTIYTGRMGSPTAGFGALEPGIVCLAFRRGGTGRWAMNGHEVSPGSIGVRCHTPEVSVRLDDTVDWAVLHLSEERFVDRFRKVTGREPDLSGGVRVHRGADHVESLRHMVESAFALARTCAADEGIWETIEDMITEEVVTLFDHPARCERPDYGRLIARCNEFLDEHPEAPLRSADLCGALNVGERTLRRFFQATYGQSPARFLRLRRLSAARRALARCPRSPGAITRVATSLGFFELGRFAVDYRAATGERPSETLSAALPGAPVVSGNA